MTYRASLLMVVLPLCLVGLTSSARADTYYFIQVHEDIPDDDPNASEVPVLTAVVASVVSDSEPDPPEPDAPGGPQFYALSLDSLEALGYMAPEDVIDMAESEGDVEDKELDGWSVKAYYWPYYYGTYLKRVKMGGEVKRTWSIGPLALKVDISTWCKTIESYGAWWGKYGISLRKYYDFSYNRNKSYHWVNYTKGSLYYDHHYWVDAGAGGYW